MDGGPDPDRLVALQGTYAGIVSRLAGFLVDVVTISAVFALAGQTLQFVVSTLRGQPFSLADADIFSRIAFLTWAFVYCAYPLARSGRTFGMAVAGIRTVRTDGSEISTRQAVLRVLLFPLSFLLLGIGFVLILLHRDRRALHDVLVGTVVVYAWDARAARLRFLARHPTAVRDRPASRPTTGPP
jgi:uncharacterized RDD family membrane protein YckC